MTDAQITENVERFPIGPQPQLSTLTPGQRQEGLEALARLPEQFRAAFEGLSAEQLDTPYREGGWSLRQVAHHVPDSHLNAYVRTRLALSEDAPTIRPYDQDAWAALSDMGGDVAVSWVRLFSALPQGDWARTFVHPEYGRVYTLDAMLASYVWHGQHHTAQVAGLRARQSW